MGRTIGNGWLVAGAVVAGLMQSAAADAQAGTADLRGVTVVAEQPMSGVDIELRVESRGGRTLCGNGRCGDESGPDELRIGDRVQICFRVGRAGYITSLEPGRGLRSRCRSSPTDYTPGAGRVDDAEQLPGRARGPDIAFAVEGPPGDSLVFLHYSPDESDQIGQEDYPVIRRVRSAGPAPYASSTVTFRIVQ